MGLGTFEEYKQRLYDMDANIYFGDEVVDRTDERLKSPMC